MPKACKTSYDECCIENCGSRREYARLYRFPNNEKCLEIWLKWINCDKLRSLTGGELRRRFVCHKHFEKRFIASNPKKSRLRYGSYPSLFSKIEIRSGIPQTSITDHFHRSLSDHGYAKIKHEDHTYSKGSLRDIEVSPATSVVQNREGTPSCSWAVPALPSAVQEFSTELSTEGYYNGKDIDVSLSSSGLQNTENIHSCSWAIPALPSSTQDSSTEPITEKTVIRWKSKSLSQQPRLYIKKHDHSKLGILRRQYMKSQNQISYLRRARRVLKFSKEKSFEKLTAKSNPLAKKKMWMQIKQCTKMSKGRRFTDKDKMIALSILKQSPKCYTFLRKVFILLSKNTLNKLIGELNMDAA